MVKYWILQFNPENPEHEYKLDDLREAINDGEEIWGIPQHVTEVKNGDVACIFKTGENRGIYAQARFNGDPYKDTDGKFVSKVIFDKNISKALLENPILMDELDDLNLINYRMGYRGTVFTVEDFQAEKINELIKIHSLLGEKGNKKFQPNTVSKQVIFYGPPGTGKTFRTKEEAVELITGEKWKQY